MSERKETVREVCAEMKDQNKSGIAQSYWNDTTVRIVDAWHCVEAYSDRILSANEREMAAKDAEIARLKAALKPVMECDLSKSDAPYGEICQWGRGTHHDECGVNLYGNTVGNAIIEWVYTKKPEEETEVMKLLDERRCQIEAIKASVNAVREAQRIMKEGEEDGNKNA